MSLRPADSSLGPSATTSTHQVFPVPRAGLAARLSESMEHGHEKFWLATLVSAVYLVVEEAGAVVDGLAVALDGVLAGAGGGVEAGVEGAVDVGLSAGLGAVSFFSPVVGAGTSLPALGFILSE